LLVTNTQPGFAMEFQTVLMRNCAVNRWLFPLLLYPFPYLLY
jgi:hypothetical protein